MANSKATGTFIAECRKEKGLTQKALGEKLNVTDRAVSKWETGRSFPDVAILEDLCQELGISVSELLAGKKIEAEHYQEETEKILVSSISKAKMYGYQIALYGMLFGSNAINLRACFHIKKQTEYGNLYDHCCVSYRFREHGISESQNSGKRIQKF